LIPNCRRAARRQHEGRRSGVATATSTRRPRYSFRLYLLCASDGDPDRLRVRLASVLPATLLTGTGVGLSFAAFGSAAVAELPRNRFATGGAISNAFRQIGGALGISALFAVIGGASAADATGRYELAWALMALAGGASGLIGLALGRVRAPHVGEEPLSESATKIASRRALAAEERG
jgi:hypothetical protein